MISSDHNYSHNYVLTNQSCSAKWLFRLWWLSWLAPTLRGPPDVSPLNDLSVNQWMLYKYDTVLHENVSWRGGGNVGRTGEISTTGLEVFFLEHFSLVTVDCQWSLISTKNKEWTKYTRRARFGRRATRGGAPEMICLCLAPSTSLTTSCVLTRSPVSRRNQRLLVVRYIKYPIFTYVILLLTPQKYSFDTSI